MPWQVLGNRRVVATRKDKYSLRRNLRRHHPKTMLPVDSFYPIGTSRIDLQAPIALIGLFGAHDSAADRAFGWQCLPSYRTQRQDRGFFMELMLPPQRIHKTALHPPGKFVIGTLFNRDLKRYLLPSNHRLRPMRCNRATKASICASFSASK